MTIPVDTISIEDIHGADYNPRTISKKELTKLKNNIDEFGLVDPIIVNLKNNRIVGGHQRYKALVSKGVKDLKMIRIGNIGWVFDRTDYDIPNEESEKILNLSLNNISGEWDDGLLNKVLQELKNKKANYKLSGFDDLDLERLKIDTEVLFDDNVLGKSWDKFKKAQGEEDWKDKYEDDDKEEVNNEVYEDEEEDYGEEEYEEEELQQLNDGIIRDEDAVVFDDEIKCPKCGATITLEMFESDFYDKVDDL